MRYHYEIERLVLNDDYKADDQLVDSVLRDVLVKRDREGWELISVTTTGAWHHRLFFRREAQ